MVTAQSLSSLPATYSRDGVVQGGCGGGLYFRLNVARSEEAVPLQHSDIPNDRIRVNGFRSNANGAAPSRQTATPTEAIDVHRIPGGLSYLPLGGHSLADLEREAIQQTLRLHKGNRKLSAAILGISVRTLQRKIKEWSDEIV